GGMSAGLADNHRLVRREAALGLGYIGDTSARPALESLAADDPERTVREAARASLDLL
ncbi:MAG: HEAT repeat domain-containing protein, partial [Proteobacteria bacterium]|nr:HEAT repeat domain-containing protein [Pseudomonadota bacterium]